MTDHKVNVVLIAPARERSWRLKDILCDGACFVNRLGVSVLPVTRSCGTVHRYADGQPLKSKGLREERSYA